MSLSSHAEGSYQGDVDGAAGKNLQMRITKLLFLTIVVGVLVAVVMEGLNLQQQDDATSLIRTTKDLSQELRQSSDDLTRFIRTYTVTGNGSYWEYFNRVIRIRDGVDGLPDEPHRNYWDLYIADPGSERPIGPPSSLLSRMRAAQFTEEEMLLLDEAKANSDALIDLENVAYHAMIGLYRPMNSSGLPEVEARNFSVVGAPNQTMAQQLTHGVFYHNEKGKIMKPIDDFAYMSAERISNDLVELHRQGIIILGILSVMLVLLVVLVVVVGIWLSEEKRRTVRVATKVTTLAQRVVAELCRYNTDRCQEIVDGARLDPEENQELINYFQQLSANLQRYRPFLPNYLFLQEEDEEEEGDLRTSTKVERFRLSEGDDLLANSRDDSRVILNGDIGSVASSQASGGSSGAPKGTGKKKSALAAFQLASSVSHHVIGFALVDLSATRLALHPPLPTEANGMAWMSSQAVLQATVDAIYKLAKETKASVHSMLGDTVQLTWNATSNVGVPEVKGVLFLIRLLRWARHTACPSATIAGAISSGPASLHTIVSHNQQNLVIGASWLPALEGCFDLAKQHNQQQQQRRRRRRRNPVEGEAAAAAAAVNSQQEWREDGGVVLMDERTFKIAHMHVQSCAVERLSYLSNPLGTDTAPIVLDQDRERRIKDSGDENCFEAATMLLAPKYTFLCHYPLNSPPVAAGSITKTTASTTTTTTVYQIIVEREEDDIQDEWMYQLQRLDRLGDGDNEGGVGDGVNVRRDETTSSSATAFTLQTKAVLDAGEGRFKDALEVLKEVPVALARDLNKGGGGGKMNAGGALVSSTCSSVFTSALMERCQAAVTELQGLHHGNQGNEAHE